MGWLSTPLQLFQSLVASSEEFQTVTGFETEAEAKAKVLRWSARDDLSEEQVPRAIIAPAGDRRITKKSTTGWRLSGGLVVMFEFDAPADKRTSREVAFDWFYDSIDQIMEDMVDQSGVNGYLIVKDFIEFEPPDFLEKDENGGDWILTATFIVVT